ncbi:hypothetical protein BLOT_001027 [Blomia tropicalis]|nr:hypothetical protein BLOT_001027 [Blomia tropicalis]
MIGVMAHGENRLLVLHPTYSARIGCEQTIIWCGPPSTNVSCSASLIITALSVVKKSIVYDFDSTEWSNKVNILYDLGSSSSSSHQLLADTFFCDEDFHHFTITLETLHIFNKQCQHWYRILCQVGTKFLHIDHYKSSFELGIIS